MADDGVGSSGSNGNGLSGPGPLDGLESAWEYLAAARDMGQSDRPPHLQRWLELVGRCEGHEQDALLDAGREVWRYRMDTARASLREIGEVLRGVSRTAVTFATDEMLAESVYRAGADPEIAYLVHRHDRPDDLPELKESLEAGKTTLYPPNSELITAGVVLLPSGVEEYGSDWDLFRELRSYIMRFLYLDDDKFRVLACTYILMTWVHDRFYALPYLRAQGSVSTGKTTLLQVIGSVCYRPLLAGGATTSSPLFRIIDRFHGTVVIDEADFERSELWQEIVKILNAGYRRGFPVLRSERTGGDGGFDVKAYDTFGPKLLATRRRFEDAALESRCLSHTMPLIADLPDRTPLVLGPEFSLAAQRLRNKLLLWRFRHWARVSVDPRARIRGVEPRINQVIQPLLACLDDERLRETVQGMVEQYSLSIQAERRDSLEGAVTGALLTTWLRRGRPDRMALKTVTEELRVEHDLEKIHDRKVSDILRRSLSVTMETRGGRAWIRLTWEKARQLALRYGLMLEEYGLVGAAGNGSGGPLPDGAVVR